MNIGVALFLFILLFICILLTSILIAHIVDNIQRRFHIGGSFVAGILLALITSIPELIICFTLIIQNKNDGEKLVLGDVYGGMIMHTAALALLIIIFYKNFKQSVPSKLHVLLNSIIFCTYLLFLVMVFMPQIKYLWIMSYGMSAICVGVYICDWIIMKRISGVSVNHIKKRIHTSKWNFVDGFNAYLNRISLTSCWIWFFSIGLFICGAAYSLILVSDVIQERFFANNAATFGTIFLALVTSAPEIISAITLFKIGNVNAGIADLAGSTVFDIFMIGLIFITVGWIPGSNKPFFGPHGDNDIKLLVMISCAASGLILSIFGVKQFFYGKKNKKLCQWLIFGLASLCISAYIVFIILTSVGVVV